MIPLMLIIMIMIINIFRGTDETWISLHKKNCEKQAKKITQKTLEVIFYFVFYFCWKPVIFSISCVMLGWYLVIL